VSQRRQQLLATRLDNTTALSVNSLNEKSFRADGHGERSLAATVRSEFFVRKTAFQWLCLPSVMATRPPASNCYSRCRRRRRGR